MHYWLLCFIILLCDLNLVFLHFWTVGASSLDRYSENWKVQGACSIWSWLVLYQSRYWILDLCFSFSIFSFSDLIIFLHVHYMSWFLFIFFCSSIHGKEDLFEAGNWCRWLSKDLWRTQEKWKPSTTLLQEQWRNSSSHSATTAEHGYYWNLPKRVRNLHTNCFYWFIRMCPNQTILSLPNMFGHHNQKSGWRLTCNL